MNHKQFIKGLFTHLVNNHDWKELSKSEKKEDSNVASVITYTHDGKTWELVHHTAWGHGFDTHNPGLDYLLLFEKPYPSSANKVNFKLDNIKYLPNKQITWYNNVPQHPLNKKLQQEMFVEKCISYEESVESTYEKLADFYNKFIISFPEFMKSHEYQKTLEYCIDIQKGYKDNKGKDKIKCKGRNVEVPCTPEEQIRQGVLQYLLDISKVPKNNLFVEEHLSEWGSSSNGRIDILITYEEKGKLRPLAIIECKKGYGFPVDTPEILKQALHYAEELDNPPFIFTTNGEDIFSIQNGEFISQTKFPTYTSMKNKLN